MSIETNITPTLIRLPEVKRRTGLGRSTIYRLEAEGDFPLHCNPSPNSAAWVSSEVDQWVIQRITSRDTAARKQVAA